MPYSTGSARDTLLRHFIEGLTEDKYAGEGGTAEEYDRAFERMREDARRHKDALALRPSATPSGRDMALSFLKATVEDMNKTMSERMDAARILLAHGEEEK